MAQQRTAKTCRWISCHIRSWSGSKGICCGWWSSKQLQGGKLFAVSMVWDVFNFSISRENWQLWKSLLAYFFEMQTLWWWYFFKKSWRNCHPKLPSFPPHSCSSLSTPKTISEIWVVTYLSIYPSIHWSIDLSTYLAMYPSTYLTINLSIYISRDWMLQVVSQASIYLNVCSQRDLQCQGWSLVFQRGIHEIMWMGHLRHNFPKP